MEIVYRCRCGFSTYFREEAVKHEEMMDSVRSHRLALADLGEDEGGG